MPRGTPTLAILTLLLSLRASAHELAPGLFEVGKPVRGTVLDPAYFRQKDGTLRTPVLKAAISLLSVTRAQDAEMDGINRADEVDELQTLLEDVLTAAPRGGVQVFFDRQHWGVDVRWFDSSSGRHMEAFGRFEPSLIAGDGKLALDLWAREAPNSSGPTAAPLALIAQYIGNHEKLEIVRREEASFTTPTVYNQQSVNVRRRSGDAKWIAEALARLSSARLDSVIRPRFSLPAPSPESSVFDQGQALHCESADLSDQFPENGSRDQGDIGSCHIFASLAPLEAALYRMYGLHIRLSEADLFLRRKVGSKDFWERGWRDEGDFPSEDLRFAIDLGVATARRSSYEVMKTNYPNAKAHFARIIKRMSDLNPGSERAEAQRMTAEPRFEALSSKLVGGASQKLLAEERATIREALGPVRIESREYTPSDSGITQKRDIADFLCRGLPVAVTMDLSGLPEWGQRGATTDALHAFIVKGFRRTMDGDIVLLTRNSWGDMAENLPAANPDINELVFSRILAVDAVTSPAGVAPAPGLSKRLVALAENGASAAPAPRPEAPSANEPAPVSAWPGASPIPRVETAPVGASQPSADSTGVLSPSMRARYSPDRSVP